MKSIYSLCDSVEIMKMYCNVKNYVKSTNFVLDSQQYGKVLQYVITIFAEK